MTTQRLTGSQTDSGMSDADLTGKEYHGAKRTATGLDLCGAADFCDGVITEGKAAGLHSSIATGNQVKAIAGAAITVGQKVTPDANGKFVPAAATQDYFGTARSAAAAEDDLFSIEVDRGKLET